VDGEAASLYRAVIDNTHNLREEERYFGDEGVKESKKKTRIMGKIF